MTEDEAYKVHIQYTFNAFASYDRATEQMAKIIDFKNIGTPEKRRKSG